MVAGVVSSKLAHCLCAAQNRTSWTVSVFFGTLMTQLTNLWNLLPLLGLLIVIAAIAITIARVRRSRAPNLPGRAPEPAPTEEDAAFLDSSHIGLEPFLGAKNLARYGPDSGVSGNDSEGRPR
jgi:hypothetical protein